MASSHRWAQELCRTKAPKEARYFNGCKMNRENERKYWDSHGVDEYEHVGEKVEVEVKRPLRVILSIRVDEAHMSKLKIVATASGVGVTTLARKLRVQALEEPGSQLGLEAAEDDLDRGVGGRDKGKLSQPTYLAVLDPGCRAKHRPAS